MYSRPRRRHKDADETPPHKAPRKLKLAGVSLIMANIGPRKPGYLRANGGAKRHVPTEYRNKEARVFGGEFWGKEARPN